MAKALWILEARGQRLKGNGATGLCKTHPHLTLGLGWCLVQELALVPGQLPYQELWIHTSLQINSYVLFSPFNEEKKNKISSPLQCLKPNFTARCFGMLRRAGSPRGEGADHDM